MSMQSIDAITPAYDFTPMSPTLKRLVELAVQARRDAAFFGLEPASGRTGKAVRRDAGSPAESRPLPETAPASRGTVRLDLRA